MTILRRRSVLVGAAAATLGAPSLARAQADWPKGAIKIIVPFPPGGSTDPVARIIQAKMIENSGWNILVDNKPGGTGAVGSAIAAKSAPDGQTWMLTFDSHILNPAFATGLPYKDSELFNVMQIGRTPQAICAHPDRPYKTFADVIAAAKTKKGASYGSIGSGSLGHLAMALLGKGAGLEFQHIPYKGGGPLMNDALAGHVPLAIGSVFLVKPHIDSKRMRPLAVTTPKRSPDLPEVPTLAESGFPGFDAPAWWAVLAPAKTPPDILRRMNEEINKVMRMPDTAKRLDAQGIDVVGGTPEAARVFIERQMDTWSKVVKDNNIQAD